MIAIALLALTSQHYQFRAARLLEHLGIARKAFEKKVLKGDHYLFEQHIYAMTFDQHLDGYYPLGASDRRFLTNIENGHNTVLYQKLKGKHVYTLWRLELGGRLSFQNKSVPSKLVGTMARMLVRKG